MCAIDTFPVRALAASLLVGCYSPSPQPGAPCADGRCPAGLVCSPATNTCERSAIDAPMPDAGPDAFVIIDGAPSPFLYTRRLAIQNTSNVTLPTGFTIRIPMGNLLATLLTQGKIKADYSDLRVIADGSVGERNRIIDPATGPAPPTIWFSLALPIAAGATSNDYALYYGAPNATAAPANGGAVFPLYDDFTNGIASTWMKNDAPTTSNGKLVLRAAHTDALTTNATTDNVPIVSAVDLLATIENPASEPTTQTEGTFWYWFGYQHTGDFSASDPWIVWIARAKNQIHGEQKSPVGCEMQCDGATSPQTTTAHYYAIERDPTATRFYLDDALPATVSVTNNADYSVMVRNYMATSAVQIDWIRARARVSPDPTITIGAEQGL